MLVPILYNNNYEKIKKEHIKLSYSDKSNF
jgi:hypothetical protein